MKKTFDCVKFKQEAQARIYEEIKDMTPEQEIEYFRKAVENGPFAELMKRLDAAAKKPRAHA